MPVRVKCRCGQEIVLRYGEWVYVFLGLVLLAVLVNMLALLLLYLRVDEKTTPTAPTTPSGREAPATTESWIPDVPPGGWRGPRSLEPPPGEDAGAPGESPPLQAGAGPSEGPGFAPDLRASEGSRRPGSPRPLRTLSKDVPSTALLDDLVGEPESVAPAPAQPAPSAPSADTEGDGHPWVEEPVLIRLMLLERSIGTKNLVAHALLSDPDPRIRRRAVARVSSEGFLSQNTTQGERARLLLRQASAWLEKDPRGRLLLETHSGTPGGSRPPPLPDGALENTWEALRKEADPLLSDKSTRVLREHLHQEASEGTELVLVVDVSQSMADALDSLRRETRWLLPAISWALPETRIGLVLFRDDVEAVQGFSPAPGNELLKAIGGARAEGGGDVTEGVHHALRVALSRGRFGWRAEASRNVVLIGDAPPPYAERAGLVLLAGQAFRQGQYRFHALSFDSGDEFPSSSPCLPAVARQGGGRATTVGKSSRLGTEVFLCLFPRDAEPAVEFVAVALRRMFTG